VDSTARPDLLPHDVTWGDESTIAPPYGRFPFPPTQVLVSRSSGLIS
jgi:hypothetical protein